MVKEHVYPEEEKTRHIQRRCAELQPPPARKIYLASPYSARTEDGTPDTLTMTRRHKDVCQAAGILMKMGFIVFSPIAHSVSIADTMDNHLDGDFWLKQDFPLIHWCEELWMLQLDGWDKSVGMAKEREYAERLCKPIKMVQLEGFNMEVVDG